MSYIKENLNVSNSLSFSRIFLSIPMIIFLVNDMNYYAIGMGLLAYLTDIGDGYFARKLNEVTNLGKVIDPIADKIFVGSAALAMVLLDRIPLWFVIVVLGRDLLILLGGLYASRKVKVVIQSNYVGKVSVMIIAFAVAIFILDIKEAEIYGLVAACGAVAATLVSYSYGLIKLLKSSGYDK